MHRQSDPLYHLFEQHLLNALVEEESHEEFVNRVVQDYLATLLEQGSIPRSHLASLESDLREEVQEMLRKKTYGHYSLGSFRKAQAANQGKPAAAKKAPAAAAKPVRRRPN